LAKIVGPVIEQVAQRLVQGQNTTAKSISVPTVLSQANRSAGRDGVRVEAKRSRNSIKLSVASACGECGVILEGVARRYCDACSPAMQERQFHDFSVAGRARLAELRAAGRDPSQERAARRERGQKNSQHMTLQADWEAKNGIDADPEVFRREILPRLQGIPLGVMAKATGLSQSYCSSIRRGELVPHYRHWQALRQLMSNTN
jgi:hypothetical protein